MPAVVTVVAETTVVVPAVVVAVGVARAVVAVGAARAVVVAAAAVVVARPLHASRTLPASPPSPKRAPSKQRMWHTLLQNSPGATQYSTIQHDTTHNNSTTQQARTLLCTKSPAFPLLCHSLASICCAFSLSQHTHTTHRHTLM